MHTSSSLSRRLFIYAASALLALVAGQALADSYIMNPYNDFKNQGPPYPDGVYVVTSEHFAVWYGTGVVSRGFAPNMALAAKFAANSLSNLEACFTLYFGKFGWAQFGPCLTKAHAHYGDGNSYKGNLYMLGTDMPGYGNGFAFGGGDGCGIPAQWCDPNALADKSWVTPHELNHGID